MICYFDSHAHLTSPTLNPVRKELVERALRAGVDKMVNICTDPTTLSEGLILQQEFPKALFTAGATPPHDVVQEGESAFPLFAKSARGGKLAAIGETGLDYYSHRETRALQHTFLLRYMALALECSLPLIFHCRDAFGDLFSLAQEHYANRPAILHCFTGGIEEAKEAVARGWMLSFSGIITFKKSEELRAVAKEVPLSHLLIETDAPYLAPQSKRGKQNEPSFLPETAATLAALHGLSVERLAEITFENGMRLFSK